MGHKLSMCWFANPKFKNKKKNRTADRRCPCPRREGILSYKLHLFLPLKPDLGSRFGRFNSKKVPWYPFNMRLRGFQSQFEHFGKKKNILPVPGYKPRTFQTVVWAVY